MLGLLTSTATHSRLFGWTEKVAGLLPQQVLRRLPMLREWRSGRDHPGPDGPTFRELWDEGIE